METWGYLGATLMGMTLGLIGGGGSILSVPLLVYFFGIPGAVATYYSLAIVGTTAAAGLIPYARRARVDFSIGFAFFLPAALGVLVSRRVLLPWLPHEIHLLGAAIQKDGLILGAFSLVMLAAAGSMILGKTPASDSESPGWIAGSAMGFFIGCLTGFVGAGGGFLIVPALVVGLRVPMERAVGTSLLVISLNSVTGFLADWAAGMAVDWGLVLRFIAFALIGVAAGARAARSIPGSRLKTAFGWFVLVLGGWILTNQLLLHLS